MGKLPRSTADFVQYKEKKKKRRAEFEEIMQTYSNILKDNVPYMNLAFHPFLHIAKKMAVLFEEIYRRVGLNEYGAKFMVRFLKDIHCSWNY